MRGQGYKNLMVYKKEHSSAMEIFKVNRTFPKEETYALADQLPLPTKKL
jgi:hypothetical protein